MYKICPMTDETVGLFSLSPSPSFCLAFALLVCGFPLTLVRMSFTTSAIDGITDIAEITIGDLSSDSTLLGTIHAGPFGNHGVKDNTSATWIETYPKACDS